MLIKGIRHRDVGHKERATQASTWLYKSRRKSKKDGSSLVLVLSIFIFIKVARRLKSFCEALHAIFSQQVRRSILLFPCEFGGALRLGEGYLHHSFHKEHLVNLNLIDKNSRTNLQVSHKERLLGKHIE